VLERRRGGQVYASLTTIKAPPENLVEIARVIGEEMLPWYSEIDGFRGLFMLGDEETGETQVLALWETKETLERHKTVRLQVRDRITSAVNVEVVAQAYYTVAFAKYRELADEE
jgi:hypothetical protein